MVNSKKKILYEANDFAKLIDKESGRKFAINLLNDNNGVVNASNKGLNSNGEIPYFPAKGYDGSVTVSQSGKWVQNNDNVNFRANIVFHELFENYFRTEKGINYNGTESDKGAHDLANLKENAWWNKSSVPGSYKYLKDPVTKEKMNQTNKKIFEYVKE